MQNKIQDKYAFNLKYNKKNTRMYIKHIFKVIIYKIKVISMHTNNKNSNV
jgi:hypothetical protein